MATFKRCIPDALADKLQDLARVGSNWWADLLAHRFTDVLGDEQPLFLAFRNGYLNAYVEGQSTLKIGLQSKTPRAPARIEARIHHKYVCAGAEGQDYLVFDGETVRRRDGAIVEVYEGAHTFRRWAEKAQTYARPTPKKGQPEDRIGEKQGVAAIAARNPHVIDLEMALPANPGSEPVADRIDLVALERRRDAIRIVFYEAKHYENRASLRARTGDAKVVMQLARYRAWLQAPGREEEVIRAMREACRRHAALHAMRGGAPDSLDSLIRSVIKGDLTLAVDSDPRLIILGPVTGNATAWMRHREELIARLGTERVVLMPGLRRGLTKEERATAEAEMLLPSGHPDHAENSGSDRPASEQEALRALARLAPTFNAPGFDAGYWHTSPRNASDPIDLGGFVPSGRAEEFIQAAHRHGLVRRFDWASWAQTPAARHLAEDPRNLASADFVELWKLITSLVRGDQFNEGLLGDAFRRRIIAAICDRAKTLLSEGPA